MTGAEGGTLHRVAVTAADAGDRLDRALAAALPVLSRSRIKALIAAGQVAEIAPDGRRRTISEPSARVKSGQTFAILVPDAAPAKPEAQAIALDIRYEDDAVIVIDKPAGLVVHPAPGNLERTLVNALIAHCGDSLSGIGGERRPGIVHRLDKDTSGLMVVAKTDLAHRSLAAQFAAHTVDRAYTALVWGVPRPAQGRIEGAIGRSPRNRKKMAVLARGKPAVTRYRVRERFGDVASLVECRLETGRTHQIRVHMAHIGHPVVGDPVYGRKTFRRVRGEPEGLRAVLGGMRRQSLHAHLLGFEHPCSKNRLVFESKIPDDIKGLLNELKNV